MIPVLVLIPTNNSRDSSVSFYLELIFVTILGIFLVNSLQRLTYPAAPTINGVFSRGASIFGSYNASPVLKSVVLVSDTSATPSLHLNPIIKVILNHKFSISIRKTGHLTFSIIFLDTLPRANSFFTPFSLRLFAITIMSTFFSSTIFRISSAADPITTSISASILFFLHIVFFFSISSFIFFFIELLALFIDASKFSLSELARADVGGYRSCSTICNRIILAEDAF